MATAIFVCQKCGAGLALPPNPVAMSAHCSYCNTETVLPAHVLAARQQQLQPMPYYGAPGGYPMAPMQGQQPYPPVPPYPIQPITAVTPLSGDDGGRRMRMMLWIIGLSVLLPLVFAGGIMWFVSSTINQVIRHR